MCVCVRVCVCVGVVLGFSNNFSSPCVCERVPWGFLCVWQCGNSSPFLVFVCAYVYTYLCMFVCVYIYIYIYICIYVYVCEHVFPAIYIYIYKVESINKVNFAKGVGNRKQYLQSHLCQISQM